MRSLHVLFAATLALAMLCATPFASAQAPAVATAAAAAPQVELRGFPTPVTLDAASLKAWRRAEFQGNLHDDAGHWVGVPMIEVLRRAGAPVDDKLRGTALDHVVRVTAGDGYAVTFSLAEFDPKFGDNGAILVYERDGNALTAHEGPFRLVLPHDVRAARSVRQVTKIELRAQP